MFVDVHEDAIALRQGLRISQVQAGHCRVWLDAASPQDGRCDVKALNKRDRIFVDVYEHDMNLDALDDISSNLTARVVIDGWDKLIARPTGNELYDLKNDPDDRTDISAQHPQKVKKFSGLIDDWLEATPFTRTLKSNTSVTPPEK